MPENLETMSSKTVVMYWYHNESQWKIQSIRNIVSPRKEYEDYCVGDKVLAKCDGRGPFRGIILHITDNKTKEEKAVMKEVRQRLEKYIEEGHKPEIVVKKMGLKVELYDKNTNNSRNHLNTTQTNLGGKEDTLTDQGVEDILIDGGVKDMTRNREKAVSKQSNDMPRNGKDSGTEPRNGKDSGTKPNYSKVGVKNQSDPTDLTAAAMKMKAENLLQRKRRESSSAASVNHETPVSTPSVTESPPHSPVASPRMPVSRPSATKALMSSTPGKHQAHKMAMKRISPMKISQHCSSGLSSDSEDLDIPTSGIASSTANVNPETLVSEPSVIESPSHSPVASPRMPASKPSATKSASTPGKRQAYNVAMECISPMKTSRRSSGLSSDSEDMDISFSSITSSSGLKRKRTNNFRSRLADLEEEEEKGEEEMFKRFRNRLADFEEEEEKGEEEMFKRILISLKRLEKKVSKVDQVVNDIDVIAEEVKKMKKRIKSLEKNSQTTQAVPSLAEPEIFKGFTKTQIKSACENETDQYESIKKMLYLLYTEEEISKRSMTGRPSTSKAAPREAFNDSVLACLKCIIKDKFGNLDQFTGKLQNVIKHARKQMKKRQTNSNASAN